MKTLVRCLVLALLALVAGCATVDVADYRAEKPAFDLPAFFDGTIDGAGMFQDRSGKVVKRFTVRIDARWAGSEGTLDEHFEFSDGTTQRRVWTLRRAGDGFEGTAGDVVGAAHGREEGNAFRIRYVLALPVDGRVWNVDMDDWMFRIDERTVLNRTTMSKFGFRLGEVTLAMRRR